MLKFYTSALAALIVVAASTPTVFANAESDAKRCVTEVQNRVARFNWNVQAITEEKLENIARALSAGRFDLAVAEARDAYQQAETLGTSAGESIRELGRTCVRKLLHKNRPDLARRVKEAEETALESIRSTLRRQRAVLQAELQ